MTYISVHVNHVGIDASGKSRLPGIGGDGKYWGVPAKFKILVEEKVSSRSWPVLSHGLLTSIIACHHDLLESK